MKYIIRLAFPIFACGVCVTAGNGRAAASLPGVPGPARATILKDITFTPRGSGLTVVIQADGSMEHKAYFRENPLRLVLEIPNVTNLLEELKPMPPHPLLLGIRTEEQRIDHWFPVMRGKTLSRLIFDLKRPAKHFIWGEEEMLTVELFPASTQARQEPPDDDKIPTEEPEETALAAEPEETVLAGEPETTVPTVAPAPAWQELLARLRDSPTEQPETAVPVGQPEETVPTAEPGETVTAGEAEETLTAEEPEETGSAGEPEETLPAGEPETTVPIAKPAATVSTPPVFSIEPKDIGPALFFGPVQASSANYLLGPEDVLEIRVFEMDQFDRTVRISGDGSIELPLIGSIPVSGLDPEQAAARVAQKLQDGYVQNPQVDIFVREFNSRKISLLGAVKKPATYPLVGRLSLLQLIADAGGVTEDANRVLYVFRQSDDGRRARLLVPLNELLVKGDPHWDIWLVPGDVVSVPPTETISVSVLGAVSQPGIYELPEDEASLLQALASAGGLNQRGSRKGIEIQRRGQFETAVLLKVDLGDILSGKKPDLMLLEGDVIHVNERFF
jgi:polysaccharide export outer membrane protein